MQYYDKKNNGNTETGMDMNIRISEKIYSEDKEGNVNIPFFRNSFYIILNFLIIYNLSNWKDLVYLYLIVYFLELKF